MQPWYTVVVPRKEVREGRSFNPDEFAIALEQVVAKTAPLDYRDPVQFFSRTYFTRALQDHAGMVLRRLSGETENAAPVMALLTQFGGGKTHTLTALYHLVKSPDECIGNAGVRALVDQARLQALPKARVAVFVGNAWDPSEENPTPWVDFPIAAVSKHAVKEKSIRHGHPSTLHLSWARRPLASSRAVLLALPLPDPGDDYRAPRLRCPGLVVLECGGSTPLSGTAA